MIKDSIIPLPEITGPFDTSPNVFVNPRPMAPIKVVAPAPVTVPLPTLPEAPVLPKIIAPNTVNPALVKNPTTVIKTIVTDDLGAPIKDANLYVNGIAVGGTDAKGFIQATVPNNANIKISFVTFLAFEGTPATLAAKTVLKTETLPEIVIHNHKKHNWLWWIIGGIVIIGGYKYYYDQKKKRVVKAKI